MRGGDLCFQETAAICRHCPVHPTHSNHIMFLCTISQKYVHLYDKMFQAYGKSPGMPPYVSFKKAQTLLSNVQLIRLHIAKVGIYME